MQDVTTMTDAELEKLIEKCNLVAAARAEVERRRIDHNGNTFEAESLGTRVIRMSDAACPECGRNDAVSASKTMYGTPELARGGEPTGTMVFCSACRTWYNAQTGEYVNPSKTYTY